MTFENVCVVDANSYLLFILDISLFAIYIATNDKISRNKCFCWECVGSGNIKSFYMWSFLSSFLRAANDCLTSFCYCIFVAMGINILLKRSVKKLDQPVLEAHLFSIAHPLHNLNFMSHRIQSTSMNATHFSSDCVIVYINLPVHR